MKTIYLKASSKEDLLNGLPFIGTNSETNEPITSDHKQGYDLDIIPPGSIVVGTRDPVEGEDITELDTIAVPNPAYDGQAENPGPRFLRKVVTDRSQDWHANLLIHPGSNVNPDPSIVVSAPTTPQRVWA